MKHQRTSEDLRGNRTFYTHLRKMHQNSDTLVPCMKINCDNRIMHMCFVHDFRGKSSYFGTSNLIKAK